jgi:mono/diheme cytochrome c family protein
MRLLIAATAGLMLAATCFSQAPTKIKKVPASDTNAASGSEMFHSYCAPCHGADGTGSGPAASALKKAPSNLTILSQKNGGKFPAVSIENTIKGEAGATAHGSRDMPVWGDLFNDMRGGKMVGDLRIKNLADYIQSLQTK